MRRRIVKSLAAILLWTPIVVGGSLVAYVLFVIFAPAADEMFGGSTEYALHLVRTHHELGKTVEQIVNERYRSATWRAFHRDYLEETYVRCDALTQEGEPVAMVWVVTAEPEVENFLPRVKVTAFAHTSTAAVVAPAMRLAGHWLYGSPDYANW